MQIRTASTGDAVAITHVHVASICAAYSGLFPTAELASIDTHARATRWHDHLASGTSTTLLAEKDGQLVGFIDFGVCRDEDLPPGAVGEVMSVYVHPESWGHGFGRELMREALARLNASGFTEVVLWVIEANRPAVRFYDQFGFVPDGAVRHREMYGTSTAVVRLRRGAAGETARPAITADPADKLAFTASVLPPRPRS
jgi:ribosomal protein S18 acetylase RimI-like enzyme